MYRLFCCKCKCAAVGWNHSGPSNLKRELSAAYLPTEKQRGMQVSGPNLYINTVRSRKSTRVASILNGS
jgi:hypothetical protein